MTNPTQQTTPDQLLESFRGRSFKSIIIFTLIVHLVVVGGTSVPYFIKSISGKSESKLTEDERTDLAVREATTVIREIATKHGIKPQDLSTRLAGGSSKAATDKETETKTETETETETETNTPKEEPNPSDATPPEEVKSEFEKQLDVKQDGPKVPDIKVEEATDDDLFK